MRGKVDVSPRMMVSVGITPAYAGKSDDSCYTTEYELGSPPRMRGKGVAIIKAQYKVGITPAYAGKSQTK